MRTNVRTRVETDAIRKLIATQVLNERRARNNLSAFCSYTTPAWTVAPHLQLICDHLEAVARGEIKRLMILMPPRHGKSELASRHFPAWYLGNYPDKEVILASYGAELANDLSRDARRIFRQTASALWGLEPSTESAAVNRWQIQGRRGKLQAAGVGGPITGRGADLALIDDPEKNLAEAESPTLQRHKHNWYRSVLRTRLAPGAAIVFIATRWAKRDLAGRLLEEAEGEGEDWEVIKLPAIAVEDDLLGRSSGEALWPDRFPLSELEAVKRGMYSGRLWAALYQQDPQMDIEGALWTHEVIDKHRVSKSPQLARIVVAIDPAGSEEGDEVGIAVAGVDRSRHGYPLADLSGHYSAEQWGRLAIEAYHEWQADKIIGETNFGGDLVLRNIQAIDPDVPVEKVSASRGKAQRAKPIATKYALGLVHHVGDLTGLEQELCTWTPFSNWSPGRLDAIVWALTYLMIDRSRHTMLSAYAPELVARAQPKPKEGRVSKAAKKPEEGRAAELRRMLEEED